MRIIITSLFAAVSLVTMAQNPGYFNKKNSFDLMMTGQYPLFANIMDIAEGRETYKSNGISLIESRDHFDYGFRVAYVRTLKRNFGIGLELGAEYFSSQRNTVMTEGYDVSGLTYRTERTDIRTVTVMPKLEFSNKGGLLPMGIAHQIGLGVNFHKPLEKQYYAEKSSTDMYYGTKEFIEIPETYNYKEKPVMGFTFMYAVNMRTPVTKFLFINYGLRYTLNLLQGVTYIPPVPTDPYMSIDYYIDPEDYHNRSLEIDRFELRYLVKQRKQFSLIQASLGLTFVL